MVFFFVQKIFYYQSKRKKTVYISLENFRESLFLQFQIFQFLFFHYLQFDLNVFIVRTHIQRFRKIFNRAIVIFHRHFGLGTSIQRFTIASINCQYLIAQIDHIFTFALFQSDRRQIQQRRYFHTVYIGRVVILSTRNHPIDVT